MVSEVITPVLTPNGALGWRDIPLDGLNCYLRSIEALLRGAHYTPTEVLFELGGALTDAMPPDGTPWFTLKSAEARWLTCAPEHDRWDDVEARLRTREPIIAWPDFFYWPGSRFYRRRHVFDHAILLTELAGGRVHFLDIDAERRNAYRDSIEGNEETRRAFKRLLTISVGAPKAPPSETQVYSMISASVPTLLRWRRGLDRVIDAWQRSPRPPIAHAVEWWIFSDLLPQAFLYAGICATVGETDLSRVGDDLVRQAKKTGLFLIALNEYRSVAPYDLSHEDLVSLSLRLGELTLATLEAARSVVAPDTECDDTKLWRRLDALLHWHAGQHLD